MADYVQPGMAINYTNSGEDAIKAGDVVVLTSRIGVAACDIPAGALGAVSVAGVYEMPAETTAAFTVGQALYWDGTNHCLTATAGSAPANPLAGWATEPKATASSVARVRLGG